MKKFIASLLRDLKPKKYVTTKVHGVGVPMYSSVLDGQCSRWLPLRVSEINLRSYHVRTRVLRKNELAAVTETGAFKVGDGVTPFENLPWATRLPVIEHVITKEI